MRARCFPLLLLGAVLWMPPAPAGPPTVSARPAPPPELVLQLCADAVTSDAAYSPDGRLLATAAGKVQLWDARSGALQRNLEAAGARHLAFSPDGKSLVVSGDTGGRCALQVWDAQSWRLLRSQSTAWCSPVFFSPNGDWVTAGVARGRLGLHRIGNPATVPVLLPAGAGSFPCGFGGRFLLTTSDDPDSGRVGRDVSLVDWHAGRIVRRYSHAGPAAISRGGSLLATGGARIELRSLTSGKTLWTRKSRGEVVALAFSADSRLLLEGWYEGEESAGWLAIDVRNGKPYRALNGAEGVDWFACGPPATGTVVLGGGRSFGTIDLRTGRSRWGAERTEDPVNSLAFSPDGRHLAVGHGIYQTAGGGSSTEGTVHLWNLAEGRLERTLPGVGGQIACSCSRALAFSADGKLLAVGGGWSPGTLVVWETGAYRLLRGMEGFPTLTGALGFAGRELIAGSVPPAGYGHDPGDDWVIKRWDPRSGKESLLFSGVGLLAVSPDGRRIATFGRGSAAYVRPPREDAPVTFLAGHHGAVTCAAFSRDGSLLVTGCEDHVPRVWDAADGRLVRAFPGGHLTGVSAIAFSPDHRLLASAGLTTKLWEVETGKLLRTIHATGPLAFSPDGRLLAIGSEAESATLWDPATGALRATLLVLPARGEKPKRREWLAFTPDGYYERSPGAASWMRWRVGEALLPAARLERERRRPERVEEALSSKP